MRTSLPDGVWVFGEGMYAVCPWCENIVKLNKFLVGSLHVCLTDEERAAKVQAVRQRQAAAKS